MLVISFGTDDEHYSPYVSELQAMCEQHGLEHEIQLIRPWTNDTQAVCAYKAQFIRHVWKFWAREVGRLDPLLWLDVDTTVTGPITLPGGDWDVGWCVNPAAIEGRSQQRAVGAAYAFRPTAGAKQFLDLWVESCQRYQPGQPADHQRFDQLVNAEPAGVQLQEITEGLRGSVEFWTRRGQKRLVL